VTSALGFPGAGRRPRPGRPLRRHRRSGKRGQGLQRGRHQVLRGDPPDGVVYVADDGATFEGKPRVLELFTRIFASQPAPHSRSRTQSPRPRATSPGCDSTGRGQGGRTAVRAWRPQSSLGWAVRGRWRRSKTPPAGTPPTDVARLVRSRHLTLPRCGRRHSKFLREGKLSTPTESASVRTCGLE
jgi:hypothetical protein